MTLTGETPNICPLSKIAPHYTAIVIDTRPSFSLMTEMGLLAATHAIVPVESRYLETVGLMNVISKINEIREGCPTSTPAASSSSRWTVVSEDTITCWMS